MLLAYPLSLGWSKLPLLGVVICISGVLDSMSRADMEEYVAKHGGKAVLNSTPPCEF